MKKILLLLGLVICSSLLFSLGTLRVESIKELPAEHMNLEVYDADGKYAPVLIVKTELKGVGIQNIGRPTKHAPEYNPQKNEYKFYMNDNQRVVEITHSKYQPLEVRLLADFGINVKAKRVYELVLDDKPEKEFVNVVIISDPSDATKIIDDKDMGTGQSFELAIGKHTLKLQKSGYKYITKDIEVTRRKTLFNNLTLPEQEPVMLTIKSEPTGADIYINNVLEGATNKQLFKFPDTYNLRLVKDKYDTIERTITVTEDGSNNFNYTLRKNTSTLTIQTTPANCDIYVNNEKMSGNSKDVSAGMYKVEVKKEGYYDNSRTVDVQKGQNKTVNISLEQKTGKLQFVIEPMEAQITLKLGNKTVETWTGSKYFSSLPVGSYTLTAGCDGYKSQNKQVVVNLDETTKIDIALEEGSDIPASMVFVQGGSFQMGSNSSDANDDEQPVHTVSVDDFFIGKYEVTQKEWREVMGDNPSRFKGDNRPVENVSWYDAVEFCNKKSEMEGLEKCYSGRGCDFSKNGYRLPTEAEWEYAARGGIESDNANYRYAGSNDIDKVAWYWKNSGDTRLSGNWDYGKIDNNNCRTHPVGQKQPNELGIYDMSGNVGEWCWDWYDSNYYAYSPKNNPQRPSSGSYRVNRGGSWADSADGCRVAGRSGGDPDRSYSGIGFRVVRSSK
ncbi:MAG: hypothetical protein PWQ09_1030 [Candidatus Cloacimonadota bacterium]|nr:hypothetical protein [Candidatus Cloacimonadota bacterium]